MRLFEAETTNEAWTQAASMFVNGEQIRRQPSQSDPTYELLHAAFTIRNPRERWVLSRQPAINPAFAIVEVVWILSGRNDSKLLNHWNPKLPEYSGHGEWYHGAYGYRLRHQFSIDQLERAYLALRNNPNSRQIVLQIWDPKADLPDVSGRAVAPDIPCNVSSLLKIREGKLEWMQIMRSNDLFRGLPYNFVQFTTLQEVIAGWLGVGLGSYSHLSDSLHVYERDVDQLKGMDLKVEVVPNTDSLYFPKRESNKAFNSLNKYFSAIAQDDISMRDLQEIVETCELPQAFENLLRIVIADAARRKHWTNTKYVCIMAHHAKDNKA